MLKVKVVFFASLKERIGQSEYLAEIALPLSIGDLKHLLASQLNQGSALHCLKREFNLLSTLNSPETQIWSLKP